MVPLRCHSHYSLQASAAKPAALVKRAVTRGFGHVGFTDLGSVSGMVDVFAAAKDACKHCGNPKSAHDPAGRLLVKAETCPGYEKASIVPAAGVELFVPARDATDKEKDNQHLSRLTLMAPDRAGWDRLIRVVSESNRPDRFVTKPRLDLGAAAALAESKLLALDGYPGSRLADSLFEDPRAAYLGATADQVRGMLRSDWLENGARLMGELREAFSSVYVALSAGDGLASSRVIAECSRAVAARAGVPCAALPAVYYPDQQDAADQRVMLAGKFRCNLEKAVRASEKPDATDPLGFQQFFRTNRFHLAALDEASVYEPSEVKAAEDLASRFTAYSLENPPQLPDFPCPRGLGQQEYLTELCRDGWKRLVVPKKLSAERTKVYGDRVKHEMGVVQGAGLSSYFLVVQDYIRWAVSQGMLVGPGRGSSAGSILAYLTGITRVDPVEHRLLFERFYDDSRNQPGKVSWPDIDTDFPKWGRDKVIGYMRRTYGEDKVAQIATFNPMKARSAVTEVLKARGQMGESDIKELTKFFPQGESAISDELQEMAEEEGSFSVIRWSLENESKKFSEYAFINDKGEIDGPLGFEMAQAVRLEGVNKNVSRHPSGIVIMPRPIGEVCPVIYDPKSKMPICGFSMGPVEKVGGIKMDILALSTLDRTQTVQKILATRRSTPVVIEEEDDSELE